MCSVEGPTQPAGCGANRAYLVDLAHDCSGLARHYKLLYVAPFFDAAASIAAGDDAAPSSPRDEMFTDFDDVAQVRECLVEMAALGAKLASASGLDAMAKCFIAARQVAAGE